MSKKIIPSEDAVESALLLLVALLGVALALGVAGFVYQLAGMFWLR